jgi:hypothetical protein
MILPILLCTSCRSISENSLETKYESMKHSLSTAISAIDMNLVEEDIIY